MGTGAREKGVGGRAAGGAMGRLAAMAGLGPGRAMAGDLRELGARPLPMLTRAGERLRDNLEREEELENADFSRVLRCWGLGEENLGEYVREKRVEFACGLGLALFAALAFAVHLCQPQGRLLQRALTGMAILSMGGCGALMALAAAWRARVVRRRRFTPFLRWLGRRPRG